MLILVSSRPRTLMERRCYEEMTEEDVKRSKLVFDESAGGCGNGTLFTYIPITSLLISTALGMFLYVGCDSGKLLPCRRRSDPADKYSVRRGMKLPAYTVGHLGQVGMA